MSEIRSNLKINSIAVYCGSSTGNKSRFMNAAQELGALFAQESIELVYGGGGAGLMGAVADAVLEAGGRVTGVITEALWEREAAHQHLTSLRIVPNMHERKFQKSRRDIARARSLRLPIFEASDFTATAICGYTSRVVYGLA